MKPKLSLLVLLFSIVSIFSFGQKRAIEHRDFDTWKRINGTSISDDGNYVLHQLTPGKGDATLVITNQKGSAILKYPRGENGTFTSDSKFVVFSIKPSLEFSDSLRRYKVKKDKIPGDSIGIYNLSSGKLVKYPQVKGFTVPDKWAGAVFFQTLDPLPIASDSVKSKTKKIPQNGKNGNHLIVYQPESGKMDSIKFVLSYSIAKEGNKFLYELSGKENQQGVYYRNLNNSEPKPLFRGKGTFENLTLDNRGDQIAFLYDGKKQKDNVDFELKYWTMGMDSAITKVFSGTSGFPKGSFLSKNGSLTFSDNGSEIFMGTATPLLVQDSLKLSEEIIQVELWNYKNSRLHTQQNVELNRDKRSSYSAVYHILSNKFISLGSSEIPMIRNNFNKNANVSLGVSQEKYLKLRSWEGSLPYDIYLIDHKTGKSTLIKEAAYGFPSISPNGNYFYWFDEKTNQLMAYSVQKQSLNVLNKDLNQTFTDERDDHPDLASAYGFAGMTSDEKELLIYDRYDIWSFSPENKTAPIKITDGRKNNIVYRYQHLDRENPGIDLGSLLLHTFNEVTKAEGFATYEGKKKKIAVHFSEDYSFGRVSKARNSKQIVYTKGNFNTFPDLQYTDLDFKNPLKISDANPEKSQYLWGSVELYTWTSLDGIELQGLLYKPEGFDPKKKYPLMVNFYERNSDNLHNHAGIVPHRSSINPVFYASRGYVVFIPDIVYRIGYPGESCYNAVIPGITSLIGEGFINKDKIGTQGHSWGGYQVAYLITKTDIFAAAESGAPVVNMISAYGGIRWGSGLSRMFQYEHTQSRIGGTLWEYPVRYMENSPIFWMDKVNTPVLIMHNDNDAAVPWYQGIEMYTALRRLDKPSWMLNYNGEPHWPTKWENIRDFNIRMQQFFDYYLMDQPIPKWMNEGIPALNKGIDDGLELVR